MSRIVLIDGENLMYGLRKLIGGDTLASRSIFSAYDFQGLIKDVLSDGQVTDILWFGARLRQYNQTSELLEKTKKAIYLQSKLVSNLQRQKINFIKVGYENQPIATLSQQAHSTRLITNLKQKSIRT